MTPSTAADEPKAKDEAYHVLCPALMGMAPVGLAVLDLEGRLREANPALCGLTGYTRQELLAPDFGLAHLCMPEDLTGHSRSLAALCMGEEETYRKPRQLRRKDGLAVWVDLVINLLRDEHGAPHALALTAIDITEQKRVEDALVKMSFHDPLTKLANRRLLQDRLQAALAQAERGGRGVAMLFIDLDEFKPINDRLGHEMGDWLLKTAARRILDCVRTYDTAARFGGDEFVVLLPNLAHPDDALRVAERVRLAMAEPFVTDDGRQLHITCSIGVSLYPQHAEAARELVHAGDEAMYLAKQAGRNRVVCSERRPVSGLVVPIGAELTSGLIHLRWEEQYASGNPFIDAEHRELFRHANQLLDLLMREGVQTADLRSGLERLTQAVAAHFEHEEKLLAKWHYPGLDDHAHKHRRLLEHAQQIIRITDDQTIPIADLLRFLVAEMIHGHMLTEDRGYFPLAKEGD